MEYNITRSINAFREMLNASWPLIDALAASDMTGSYVDDWMQANWEMVVECSIPPHMNVILAPYGSGADCNLGSSRVWRPQATPTTAVFVRYLGNEPLKNVIDDTEVQGTLKLEHFCSIKDGWPTLSPPFDHAVLFGDSVIAIALANTEFYINA
jgi:hypothetical protein